MSRRASRRQATPPPRRSTASSDSHAAAPVTAELERRGRDLRLPLLSAALVAAVVACYWRVQYFDFLTYDDPRYLNEPNVRAGLSWSGVWWALSGVHFSNWHPLTSLAYMAAYDLWGMNARAFHLLNVALHALNSVLLLAVLRRLTGSTWRSAFVAALFALHPIHVESVAWISELKDVLSTLFWILTLGAYGRYARRGGIARYLLTLGLYVLGLLSKPMVVTLPFVLLLLDFWPLGRVRLQRLRPAGTPDDVPRHSWQRLLIEKSPFLLLAGGSSVVTFLAQRSGGAVVDVDYLPLSYRMSNAVLSYARYLWKMIWPQHLAALYPHEERVAAEAMLTAGVLLLTITGLVLWHARRRGYLVTGWFWYLGTLVPVIGIVQVGAQAMADRYTYIPLIGPFIIIAWGAADLVSARPAYACRAVSASALIVLALLSIRTWLQVGYWQDSELLFRRVVEIAPDNPIAQFNLGNAYYRKARFEEAAERYRLALKLEPTYADSYRSLGLALVGLKQYAQAMDAFVQAVRLTPDSAETQNAIGSAMLLQNDLTGAETHLRAAIRLHPDYAAAHYNLGLVLLKRRREAEADAALSRAVELNPSEAGAQFQLGLLRQSRGDMPAAIGHYRLAVRYDPASPARNNLAWVLATSPDPQLRNGPEAVRLAEGLLEGEPRSSPELMDTLAAAYAERGEFLKAVEAATVAADAAAKAGKPDLEREIRARLSLYQQERPYREPR